ncbi:MAG TPA: M20/M25/M40 family metallo-hydrolase, partial [Candidatus Agrococcus pullicola]|nr:M20/M25/M40 family metallo-hydrolase [Candidatus Agrococcus pullicola]
EGADTSLPKFVVHGHLDVVPADADEWSVDPFAAEVRDGLLWGRGAVDMKNMDAMILQSVADILRSGRQPRRTLILVFFADEEAGGVYGSHFMTREHPEVFAGATEAISEVGGYSVDIAGQRAYMLQTAEKAMQWIRLTATGTAAHGSQVMRDNAVSKIAKAVAAIGENDFEIHLTDTTRALFQGVAKLRGIDFDESRVEDLAASTGGAARFLLSSLRTTANPTMLDAGYKHNVIPGSASARIDMRPLPGREQEATDRIREIVGDDIELEIMVGDIGMEQPFEGELVNAMVDTLLQHDPGAHVLPYMLSGGTDNKALSELGIRGYGFAPLKLPPDLDFAAMFHGVDERVSLEAIDFGTAVLTDLLLRY